MNINITKTVSMLRILGFSLITCCFSMFSAATQAGTIVGSVHDFNAASWNTTGEICVVCHTPHNSDTSVTVAPLWNHEVTGTTNFTLYSSNSFDGTDIAQPDGVSVLCLSCHDGSVAIDNFGGTTTGSTFVATVANIGESDGTDGNMKNDHPISFTYTEDSTDAGMHNSGTAVVIGDIATRSDSGTIATKMLSGGKVQCTSCHDVHNNYVNAQNYKLLKVSMQDSALCLTCHNK